MADSLGNASTDLVRDAAATVEWLTGLGVEWEAGYPKGCDGYRAAGLISDGNVRRRPAHLESKVGAARDSGLVRARVTSSAVP